MTVHHFTANFQSGIRHEVWQGEDHLVVPVVMIVEGVLNGALLPVAEFGRFPESWNGRPVPVLHPQDRGVMISAGRPDIIEKNTLGFLFNTVVDGNKLKSEAWLSRQKADRLGYGDMLRDLEAGGVMEVSTGYFSDDDPVAGTYGDKAYTVIHRNIRPDHLALLPGEIGACSVEDGCGTRTNSKKEMFAMRVNEAWAVITKSLGLKSNCQCEGDEHMDILKEADALVKTNALDAKQLAAIQKMAPADREVMSAFIAALQMAGDPGEEVEEEELPDAMEEDEEEKPKMMTKKAEKPPAKEVDIDALVANKVAEHLRRADVVGKLSTNEKNTLSEADMKAMSVEQLEAVEKMIRPADYSGAGAFATNGTGDNTVTPLVRRGLLTPKKKEA